MAKQTASQTVGPFFLYGLTPELADGIRYTGYTANVLATEDTAGEHIVVEGRVLDGEGDPVPDSMVEIWQANAAGRYRHAEDDRADAPLDDSFLGFGRTGTDRDGAFRFHTVKPGPVPGLGNAWQAPHIVVCVFARGMLSHAYTRLY
ncbi:MAG: protocatechuate 3,4-dioxygenase subunit alpha, partial [Rhodospirillaceae bacterium]|nr:protocatechuate 3,4-dioxygenase subunit alpha [Rhodospirillaceae bacterium]